MPAVEPLDNASFEQCLAAAGHSPTALRMVLGHVLRQTRKEAGIEAGTASRHIGGSESKVSRLERGLVTAKESDVIALLRLYGVDDVHVLARFRELVSLAQESGWWHRFDEVLPDWFPKFIGLQEAADMIRTYEVTLVPGLLQTTDYARTVIRQGHPLAGEREIDERVELRRNRQALLNRAEPPRLWALLDEAVLHRQVGGAQIMRAQFQHLADMARSSEYITLQIAPFNQTHCASPGFPVTHLRFAYPGLPDIVYLEQLRDATYLDKRAETEHYRSVLDTLAAQALDPDSSLHLLEAAAAL
ncbi:helix-turn-helix domain-containing protein [Streptomyces sp. NPDC058644]|uniref:helix-turn-helix domain-containing protein n=1 Tax=unclassified Streptomyces TaxID=2593676 RepID=UPI0036615B75